MATEAQEDDDAVEVPAIADLGTGREWEKLLPATMLARYEVHNFRRAAEILSTSFPNEFRELCDVLENVEIPSAWVSEAGGNESRIPKHFSYLLRPLGWLETRITADLQVRKTVVRRVPVNHVRGPLTGTQRTNAAGELIWKSEKSEHLDPPIAGYVDGHKIDYVKNGVAFDLEWNSKDQTFDRDLFAFRTFFDCQAIEVGVLVTRSADLARVFAALGPDVQRKYGASTTWIGKLLYRLKSGRSGGCPVLAIGIKSECITGWQLAMPPGP